MVNVYHAFSGMDCIISPALILVSVLPSRSQYGSMGFVLTSTCPDSVGMVPRRKAVKGLALSTRFSAQLRAFIVLTISITVRALAFRFEAFGRPIHATKKWEEGVFSDLRNLKPGQDACLEDPK